MPLPTNSIKAKRLQLFNVQPLITNFIRLNQTDNRLNDDPTDANQIYVYEGKRYGHPKFRIMQTPASDIRPAADAFTFDKDEKTGKITLKCTIEVYRDEPDVYPLVIRNPQISLEFDAGGKKVQKVLTITETPMIDAINVLQNLHAQTEIQWDEIKDLIVALKDPNKIATFQLSITSELWWQKAIYTVAPPPPPLYIPPPPPPPPPPPRRPPIKRGPPVIIPRRTGAAIITELAQPIEARTVAKPFFLSNRLFRNSFELNPVFSAVTTPSAATTVTFTDPQKMDVKGIIICNYTKEDTVVFGPLSDEFEVKNLNWQVVTIPKTGENYTIAYRPTAQPDVFYFLPQVFRIKAKEANGEPGISINMTAGADSNKPELYHINIAITLMPYYNPRAKKDLYQELNRVTNGITKFCELRLGGYKSAKFELRAAYAGDNAVFRGKIPDSIAVIDPVNGFTLTIDCSLESFDFFKKEITENDGLIIGDIVFELLAGDGAGDAGTQRIPVELNIRKLAGIPADISPVVEIADEVPAIKGFNIINTNAFPVTIGGADLTLLSAIEDTVYDADYNIGVLNNPWPMLLAGNQQQQVLLNQQEIDNIEDRFWTQLVCESFGLSINTNASEVLEKVIDYATGDPQVWHLEISCPLFERWGDIDEATLAPFKQVTSVTVEVKNEEGSLFSVKLNKQKFVATLDLARSISQILKSQQLNSRKYQYRVGTVYIINPTAWTDWQNPESTASDFLSVIPQKLTV